MNITELVSKLEAAKEPSETLDVLIAQQVNWQPPNPSSHRAFELGLRTVLGDRNLDIEEFADDWGVPKYTASLDAALTLVPEGKKFVVGGSLMSAKHFAEIDPWQSEHISGEAPTPALALCIAALKAREGAQAPGQDKATPLDPKGDGSFRGPDGA